MRRTGKLVTGISVVLGGAAVLYAFASGPDPRHTGAPGDDKLACATSLCHTGTALNGGGGKVEVQFSNGLTYTPGVSQTFTVVITDAAAKVYGFQMTARLDSNQTNGQAGDFTAGAQQLILCDNGLEKTSRGCAAASPVQFIEHSFPFKTNTISVKWTPPASNVGNVHIYVAANAANNDGGNTGDHIYTANYTLTPASAGNAPTVSAVISAGAFNQNAGVASGSWLEIYGQNFSTTTRGWGGPDFNGNNAPTSLDGVSVTIGGKNAYVDFISPGQVNAQVPDGIPIGDGVPVIVNNASGSSSAFGVKTASIAPAVLAPSSFNVGGKQYVVAQFADQTFVGRSGLIAGVNFRPAKPGDTVVIYGIGFGPVSPANPAGVICTQSNSMVTKPNFRFGQTAGTLSYFGLVPNFVGLYQFNVTVPNVSPGDIPLNIDVGGAALNQNLFITVGQ